MREAATAPYPEGNLTVATFRDPAGNEIGVWQQGGGGLSAVDIRRADSARDAEAVAAIYAPYVTDTVISFEDVPPTAAEIAGRIDRLTNTHEWLVAVDADEILGYAYACPHRERAAYRWTAEVTVYVHRRHQRRGAGRALYRRCSADSPSRATARRSRSSRCRTTRAWAPRGVRLRAVGVYRGIGFKLGTWWDVGWWQRDLARGHDDGPPPEPRSLPAP